VKRRFVVQEPNRLWIADITSVPTWECNLYLAVVRRRPKGVIHHSDQGSQYTSLAFSQRCADTNVTPSMGSVGDCYDNAMCESFFATVECGVLHRHHFRTRREAQGVLFAFMDGWYNLFRRHSALGYLSPAAFER